MVEKELGAFIQRRSQKGTWTLMRARHWEECVRRYNAQRCEEMRATWVSYHAGQAARHRRRTLEGLLAYHKAQAARLCED